MARQQNLGFSAEWFIAEDKTIPFEVFSSDEVTMEDVTGWAIRWVLHKIRESDNILLDLSTGGGTVTITGVYNADRATNTQRVNAVVADTDTQFFQPGQYGHVLKRTDAGSATVLSYGTVHLKPARI